MKPKSQAKPKTLAQKKKRLQEVTKNFTDWLTERIEEIDTDEDCEWGADFLDVMLDDIGSDDHFGTEKQNDPRGDGRNGEPQVRQNRTW